MENKNTINVDVRRSDILTGKHDKDAIALYDKVYTIANDIGKVEKSGYNTYHKSHYVTLDVILDKLKPMLKEHNLLLTQYPLEAGVLITQIMDIKEGTYIEVRTRITPRDETPQGIGSAITYARRYAITAIFGLVAEKDDDGNRASNRDDGATNRTGGFLKKPKAEIKTEDSKVPVESVLKAVKKIEDALELDNYDNILKVTDKYDDDEKKIIQDAINERKGDLSVPTVEV